VAKFPPDRRNHLLVFAITCPQLPPTSVSFTSLIEY
jgi:hypothetical protein